MDQASKLDMARRIMLEFADDTGLSTGSSSPTRYLWTDAHAICNLLSLHSNTGEARYLKLATDLIDQVHGVLGRHRQDDVRTGWISGLEYQAGREHPTSGGLRIGKKLPERAPMEVFDERLEWDRDGQYFHYLTKWMHALCRAASLTGDERYLHWGIELAKAAHAGFRAPGWDGNYRLYWKMSIDLTRPQVPSSGLHDALDAFITYNEIQAYRQRASLKSIDTNLDDEIQDAAGMITSQNFETNDPLGIGGLLFDCARVIQLTAEAQFAEPELGLVLADASANSLDNYLGDTSLSAPAEYRLAFRELGLCIGIAAIKLAFNIVEGRPDRFNKSLRKNLENLMPNLRLAEGIVEFWTRLENQRVPSWQEHLDINRVTLATCLLPIEFVRI
jgi:hypothetical protein